MKWKSEVRTKLKILQNQDEIMARGRTDEEHRAYADFLTLLNDILRASLEAEDVSALLKVLVNRTGVLFSAHECFITLWDEANEITIPAVAYGSMNQTYSKVPAKPGEHTLTYSVLKAGHALVVEDVTNSPYSDPDVAAPFTRLRSALGLPLISGNRKLGAVILGYDEFHHFTEDEIVRGELAAGLIALTLDKFQAMEQAYHRAEESETLRKASSLVAATLDPEEAVSRILEQLEQVVPYDSASVQLLRDGELEIVGGRGWQDPSSVIGIRFPVPGDNPNSIVIQTRQPYMIDETGTLYPNFRQPPHSHIRSWLGVPLIVHNQVTGLLAIDSAEPHHFTREHVRLATAFADQVAITLENTRLFGSAQQQAKRQAALLQLSTDLAVALDEQDICKRVVHNLHDMLEFDYVSVFLVDENSGDRVLQVGLGLPDQLIPDRMPPGQGLSERPLLDGQLHYTPDVTKELNYIQGNNGSEVDVPIRIGDEVRGVLIIESARMHAFSQNDCDVLNTAANLIGLALTRAELFASEHRQFEELAVLHAIAMAMTEAKDVDELIERTTQLIGEKLFPDNFGVLLFDEAGGLLRLHSSYHLGEREDPIVVLLGQGIVGHVASTGKPERIPDVTRVPYYLNIDSNTRSELCTPLMVGERLIGVINVESAKLNAFTQEDENLLMIMASQLANGIERLRAEESLRQRAEDLAALQATVLEITTPHDLPDVLQTIVEQAAQLLNATSGGLYLCDPERQEVRCVVSYNTPRDYIGTILKYGQGAAGTVAQTEKPLTIDDYRTWGGRSGAFEKEQPFSAVLSVPMFWHGQVTGVIHVLHNVETRRFTGSDLELLSLFANHAASATENARLFAEVQNLAITDPLTGLYNRRGLFEMGRIEFARTRRFGRPFACMMLDIDRFKRVNDMYSHPIGDQVLQALAKHCQSSVREIDLIGRYGGEEFIFLMPETNLEVTKEIAERLRRTIANMLIPTDKGELSVTVSLGVAMYDENTLDLETMIARSDQAMYVAKHKGRNRIAVSR